LAAPFWLAGLYFFLLDKEGRKYAVLGYAYLIVLVEMILLHGKIYYLAPAYIMLLAGGVVWWERQIFSRAAAWLKPAIVAPLIVSAIIAAPLAMPILPVAAAVKYCAFWGVQDIKVENVPLNSLPQLFGDVTPFETISPEYALPEESELSIYVCRHPHKNLADSWTEWTYLD